MVEKNLILPLQIALPPPLPWRWVRRVALPLAALFWALAVFWRAPMLLKQGGMIFVASPLTTVPFALVLAYGIATSAVLFWANRHRMRGVLRLNRGRVVGALALAFVTPIAVFDWVPWIWGGLMVFVSGNLQGLGIMVLVWAAATGLWYPVAALIVSGTRSRWLRFGLFCLMFWAVYAAFVLFGGVAHSPL